MVYKSNTLFYITIILVTILVLLSIAVVVSRIEYQDAKIGSVSVNYVEDLLDESKLKLNEIKLESEDTIVMKYILGSEYVYNSIDDFKVLNVEDLMSIEKENEKKTIEHIKEKFIGSQLKNY